MDANYSFLKRKSKLDPENTPNLQLLKRRLGIIPIQVLFYKVNNYWSKTNNISDKFNGSRTRYFTYCRTNSRSKKLCPMKTISKSKNKESSSTISCSGYKYPFLYCIGTSTTTLGNKFNNCTG